MGKIILEFDSIEDKNEALAAVNASKMSSTIWDIQQKIRSKLKYGWGSEYEKLSRDEFCKEVEKFLEELREDTWYIDEWYA